MSKIIVHREHRVAGGHHFIKHVEEFIVKEPQIIEDFKR
jgi:hypothetical protein